MTDTEQKKQEAQLLLNQEVKIRAPWNAELRGQIATVKAIMADGMTLDVELDNGKHAFLDVTFVDEIRDNGWNERRLPCDNLGPIANHLAKETL